MAQCFDSEFIFSKLPACLTFFLFPLSDFLKKKTCEVQAFLKAIQLYRQDKGKYEAWDMLIGSDARVCLFSLFCLATVISPNIVIVRMNIYLSINSKMAT